MLRLLKDAVGDGKSMSATEYASFRDRFVTLTADLQALRQGEVRLLLAQLAGRDLGEESSIGKLQASTLGQAIAELAVVALGPLSLLTSGPHALESGHWTFIVLTSRYYSLASGSSEVQRGILAERILGLPRGDRR
jgi:alkylation response protein AidB-like acyl-CoA dehydrogenase